jgi:hypothetical protein
MARLTWWEFSWDVMEPISYFLTFGTSIIGYLFYVITKREYTFEILGEETYTRRQLKIYRRNNFDVQKYEEMKDLLELKKQKLNTIALQYGNNLNVIELNPSLSQSQENKI